MPVLRANRILVALLALALGSSAFAQEAAPAAPDTTSAAPKEKTLAIEEIVVTARKRSEDLQSVPLAITAFGEVQIDQQYANDIGELSKFAPNVILARQPYAGNALFGGMRGIVFGDLEKSFDPAVGVVVDGVPLVTNTGALIDAFDLESVEVLRGPQGTLYGRNTIAGLVNVRRSRPTKEWGLKSQFRYGDNREIDVKAVANAPIGETIGVKVGVFYDSSDGFTEDGRFDLATGAIKGTGHATDGEDTINLISSALWEPNEDLSALLTYEYTDDDSTLATPTNLTVPGLNPIPLFSPGAPPNFGAPPGSWGAISLGMLGALGACLPGDTACQGAAVGGAIGATLGSGGNFCDVYGAVFTQLSFLQGSPTVPDVACASQGYQRGEKNGYKYSYTAVPFVNHIKQHAVTLELNYDIGAFEITSVTGYRKSDEILNEDNLGAAVPIFNPIRPQNFDQISTELRVASDLDGIVNFIGGLYYVNSEYEITQSIFVFGSQFIPGASPSPDGDAGQTINSVALFGEAYVDLTEKARLTVGARWTWEEKEFWIYQRSSVDSSGLLPPTIWGCGALSDSQQAAADATAALWIASAPNPAVAADRAAALQCNDSDGKKSWSEFTPRIAVDYQITDDVMGYASWSRGFRSGGWNGRATTPSSIGPYDPETVDNYEIGLRSQFFDNRLQLNLTYFHDKYSDKQESQIFAFGNATETIVDNAAQATINGIELETQYIVTDHLSLRGQWGFVKGKYDEFEAFNRATGKIEDVSNIREFGFAPEFNLGIGADYLQPLPKELGDMHFIAWYAWADGTTGNFGQPDPAGLGRNVFPSRGEADFTLAWENKWLTVAAFVKDAFHHDNYLATSVDVGVFWFGATAPGRTWGVEFTREF
jgi:iron complex outermembrane receptor protein